MAVGKTDVSVAVLERQRQDLVSLKHVLEQILEKLSGDRQRVEAMLRDATSKQRQIEIEMRDRGLSISAGFSVSHHHHAVASLVRHYSSQLNKSLDCC